MEDLNLGYASGTSMRFFFSMKRVGARLEATGKFKISEMRLRMQGFLISATGDVTLHGLTAGKAQVQSERGWIEP